jgi:hypothetical protein
MTVGRKCNIAVFETLGCAMVLDKVDDGGESGKSVKGWFFERGDVMGKREGYGWIRRKAVLMC